MEVFYARALIARVCYLLKEKDVFLQTLKSIKPPDEYSSNISRCVQLDERKLIGMKSYDCHMLMQEYLPIALRGTLPDHVSIVIIELCDFFRRICLKDLDENDLQFLESRVAVTLCKLEKIFPPSFFTVMVHLVIHLVREVRLGGPVPFHWMFPIERMGKRIRIVSTKEVVQPAQSTTTRSTTTNTTSENNSSTSTTTTTTDEASDLSIDKSLFQGAKKRVRGPTKKKEIWNLGSHEKVLVTFNELCQPIGDEGNELTNFLGTLVRMHQHIGIQYPEWRKVPKEKKEDLWSIVKEKFSFESDHSEDSIKEWIMMDMSSKWKCWKYELKKSSYDPSMTIDEIVASQTDDRVEAGQFRKLVESWFTKAKQVESERKKINRLKSIEPHVTGTKSFARVVDEETQKNKGVRPSRGGLYCITRTRKNGSIVNAVAAQVVADIKAIGDSSTTEQATTNSYDWTNDDLSKVKGPERRGSFRCTGKFLVRKDKRLQDPQVPLLQAKVKFLEKGFMMFAAAVQEQVPNLNLSSVMDYMNMEVDDISSIQDNNIGKNTSSASGTSHHQNSEFSVHENHLNKSVGSTSSVLPVKESTIQESSLLPVKESTIQKSSLKKLGGSRHQTSVSIGDKSAVEDNSINKSAGVNGNKSAVRVTLNKSGNKSAVRETLNKSGTSRFDNSVAIRKKKIIQACLEAFE